MTPERVASRRITPGRITRGRGTCGRRSAGVVAVAVSVLALGACNSATSTSDASPSQGSSVATSSTGTPRYVPSSAAASASGVSTSSERVSASSGPKVTGVFNTGEKLVWITVGSHKVPGTLHIAGQGRAPVVLMLHGDASTRDEVGNMYADEAVRLAGKGISSLRIDFAGSGMATEPQRALTYPGMLADADGAYTWLTHQSFVDPANIGVLGFSRGGTVAASLVGKHPGIAAFASWSGAVENGRHEDPTNEAKAKRAGHVVINLGFRTFDYSYAWFTSVAASHALTDALHYRHPLLVVYGTSDTDVPPATQLAFARKVASTDVTRVPITGADHIFGVLGKNKTPSRTVIATTASWFGTKLH